MSKEKAISTEFEDKFRRYLNFRDPKVRSPVTRDKTIRHVDHLVRNGLDLVAFAEGAMEAQNAAEAFLEGILEEIEEHPDQGIAGFNNHIKVIKRLGRFYGYGGQLELQQMTEPDPINTALWDEEIERLWLYEIPYKTIRARRMRQMWRESHYRHRGLVHFALTSGWRRGEHGALEERDLDRDTGNPMIHCRRPTKGGVVRWVPVERELFSPKRPFGAWDTRRPMMEDGTEPIWTITMPDGTPKRLSADSLYRAMQHIGQATAITGLSFRRTRHTRGTLMLEAKKRIRLIMHYLGHNSIDSTVVYTRPRMRYQRAEIDGMPSMFKPRKGDFDAWPEF